MLHFAVSFGLASSTSKRKAVSRACAAPYRWDSERESGASAAAKRILDVYTQVVIKNSRPSFHDFGAAALATRAKTRIRALEARIHALQREMVPKSAM